MTIAIEGVGSLLGEALIEIISQSQLSPQDLVLIRHVEESEDGDGDTPQTKNARAVLFDNVDFVDAQYVFIADQGKNTQQVIARALEAEAIVIDCTGEAADDPNLPLIHADLNCHEVRDLKPGFALALPNAATTMLARVLSCLDSDNELIWVNACHFSPAASFGKTGIEQLAGQTARLLNGQPLEKSQRELQLAFNLLPQNGAIGEDGYTSQESRLISQTKRLLDNPDLQINATAIQAPTFYGQAQSIEIGFAYPVDIGAVERLLKQAKDIRLVKPAQSSPAVYSRDGNGEQLFISRLRQNCGNERALTLWCVADSLRHSAAVRAVQIAEMLIKSYL